MALHTQIKAPGAIFCNEHGGVGCMRIMAAYTGEFMPLFRRVWDPVGWMPAMPGSPEIRCNDMPAVTLIRVAAYTQKPDRFVKPARIF